VLDIVAAWDTIAVVCMTLAGLHCYTTVWVEQARKMRTIVGSRLRMFARWSAEIVVAQTFGYWAALVEHTVACWFVEVAVFVENTFEQVEHTLVC
jgi:hypothetical protein